MKLGIGVNLFKRREQKGTLIRDGLVAEYLFDEGRGQVLCDYSGNGNHGILGSTYNIDTNDPLWTPQGLQFDGVDDYVNCPFANIPSNALSVIVAFKLLSISTQNFHGLISRICGSNDFFPRIVCTTSKLLSQLSLNYGISTSVNIPVNVPMVVAFTYDGEMLTHYKNTAVLGSEEILISLPKGTNDMVIGCGAPYSTYHAKAVIYQVMIYDRSLLSNEISVVYDNIKNNLLTRGVILE